MSNAIIAHFPPISQIRPKFANSPNSPESAFSPCKLKQLFAKGGEMAYNAVLPKIVFGVFAMHTSRPATADSADLRAMLADGERMLLDIRGFL